MPMCQLLAGRRTMVGNNRSNSNIKTKRLFCLNLQTATFHIPLQNGSTVKKTLRVSVKALRTIAKHGGIVGFLNNVRRRNLTDIGLQLARSVKKS